MCKLLFLECKKDPRDNEKRTELILVSSLPTRGSWDLIIYFILNRLFGNVRRDVREIMC